MTSFQQITASVRPTTRESMVFNMAGLFLNQIVRDAHLTVLCPDYGMVLQAGRKGRQERYTIHVAHPHVLWTIVANPDPGAGEMFMDGQWDMEDGDIGGFITMMARNLQALLGGPARFVMAPVLKKNLHKRNWDAAHSRQNAQAHYDIGNDLYESFLDEGMNYSCAFFEGQQMSLREAQLNKIDTTLRRLGVRPGMHVLDIGCGWGEACRVVAEQYDANVTGITLARNQLEVAQRRALGMANPPAFLLEDYREHAARHEGVYDRIFSVGMFEHVGHKNYRPYFGAIRQQLKPDGRALVHSIMNASKPSNGVMNSPWLETYIFPGGRLPDLPEITEAATAEGLKLAHAPYLQPPADYAQTLRLWRGNFLRNFNTLKSNKYDARFRRMWTYYLAMCEAMFDGCGFQVGQLVFERA